MGHIGDRADNGEWETFQFDVTDTDGGEHHLTFSGDDLPDGMSWDDFFDYLEYLAEEYDVDYENGYGED